MVPDVRPENVNVVVLVVLLQLWPQKLELRLTPYVGVDVSLGATQAKVILSLLTLVALGSVGGFGTKIKEDGEN